jgi:capsular exopolysaccharide synthesis family protein
LQQQQAAIRDQRERAGLVGSSGSTELERQVADLGISLAQARADVAMRRARVVATRAGGSASQPVLDSDLIHKLREQEAQAQQRVAGLGQQHGSAYPEYAAARSQAADISAKIDQETARILRGLQTDFVTAQQREADLVAALGTLQHQREAQARAAADVDNLEHDAQATQTVYQTLLTSLSQIQAQLGAEDADARVISAASPPRLPYFPNVPVFASIALIVSSATGVALAWLLESRQRGITRLDELQDLELTALEPIPYVSARERRGRRLGDMLLAEPKSVLAEQVRALRGDLARSKGARVFALVSALPAEGKTATALLLGRSMAASGLHVLVVECDLRRPSAMRQLGLAPTRPGLVGVLRDGAPFSAAAVEDHDSPLHLLAPEEDVARPQDLLAGDALRRLLDTARAQYDYVLIDTPPLGAVSDALLVASQADCTLLVVRWKTTPVVAVRAVLRKLARHDLQVAGAVLNATNLKRSVPDGLASLYRAGRAYARGTHTV